MLYDDRSSDQSDMLIHLQICKRIVASDRNHHVCMPQTAFNPHLIRPERNGKNNGFPVFDRTVADSVDRNIKRFSGPPSSGKEIPLIFDSLQNDCGELFRIDLRPASFTGKAAALLIIGICDIAAYGTSHTNMLFPVSAAFKKPCPDARHRIMHCFKHMPPALPF